MLPAKEFFESRLKYVSNTSNYTSEERFTTKAFYDKFFDYNLARSIIQTSLETLKTRPSCHFDVDGAWKLLCTAYYQAESKRRKPGVLGKKYHLI